MFRIVVRGWKRDIDPSDPNDDKLEKMGIDPDPTFHWVDCSFLLEEIMEAYEYHGSPNKTVIEFYDQRPPLLVKESFQSFTKRLDEAEMRMHIGMSAQFQIDPDEEDEEEIDEKEQGSTDPETNN